MHWTSDDESSFDRVHRFGRLCGPLATSVCVVHPDDADLTGTQSIDKQVRQAEATAMLVQMANLMAEQILRRLSNQFSEEAKMTTLSNHDLIEANLLFVLKELENQPEISAFYSKTTLSYEDQMAQIREFIEMAGEFGLAYEYICGALESFPFKISGSAAIKLLEVGLLMGFKSELDSDKRFDRRS